jgi:hypothetical protein
VLQREQRVAAVRLRGTGDGRCDRHATR